MIISKQSLNVVLLTAKDKAMPIVDNIHIAPDGTVIGACGNGAVAVSPVLSKVKDKLHLKSTTLKEGVTISSDTAKKLLRNVPNDTVFGGLLEHLDVVSQGGPNVHFVMHDGKQETNISGTKFPGKYIDWETLISRSIQSETHKRVIINRARLKLLLETLEKVCPDTSGESPVYMDFTKDDDIIVRAKNLKNGQRCIGVMKTYRYNEEAWINESNWESRFTSGKSNHNEHESNDGAELPVAPRRVHNASNSNSDGGAVLGDRRVNTKAIYKRKRRS